MLHMRKEGLIASVYSFRHVLNGLCIKPLPVGVLGKPFQFGVMGFEPVTRQMLPGEPVVSPGQRNAMVVDFAGQFNLVMEDPVPLAVIEFVFVGFVCFHGPIIPQN